MDMKLYGIALRIEENRKHAGGCFLILNAENEKDACDRAYQRMKEPYNEVEIIFADEIDPNQKDMTYVFWAHDTEPGVQKPIRPIQKLEPKPFEFKQKKIPEKFSF
jgi:hypothetical protein